MREGAGGADLRGLLAEQRRPQAELALALQGGGLGVDAADDDHVLVEGEQLVVADVGDPGVELLAGCPCTVRSE